MLKTFPEKIRDLIIVHMRDNMIDDSMAAARAHTATSVIKNALYGDSINMTMMAKLVRILGIDVQVSNKTTVELVEEIFYQVGSVFVAQDKDTCEARSIMFLNLEPVRNANTKYSFVQAIVDMDRYDFDIKLIRETPHKIAGWLEADMEDWQVVRYGDLGPFVNMHEDGDGDDLIGEKEED